MALSTSIPEAKAMPARLTTLRLLPRAFRMIKVPMMLIGIEVPTTMVEGTLLRKMRRTTTARAPPMRMFLCTRSIAPRM
jgi:hypothetical protein